MLIYDMAWPLMVFSPCSALLDNWQWPWVVYFLNTAYTICLGQNSLFIRQFVINVFVTNVDSCKRSHYLWNMYIPRSLFKTVRPQNKTDWLHHEMVIQAMTHHEVPAKPGPSCSSIRCCMQDLIQCQAACDVTFTHPPTWCQWKLKITTAVVKVWLQSCSIFVQIRVIIP